MIMIAKSVLLLSLIKAYPHYHSDGQYDNNLGNAEEMNYGYPSNCGNTGDCGPDAPVELMY